MKAVALLSAVFFLVSCGADPCTVKEAPDGTATIACPDGTETVITDGAAGSQGPQGEQGAQGIQGAQGQPGAAGQNGADGADGQAGADGVNGQDGLPGQDGADGQDGMPGADGTDNRIVASLGCFGQLENTALWFTYKAAVLSSGDVFAAGSIYGASGENSSSAFYSAQQAGAATAPVVITADVVGAANFGWWRLSVDRATAITTIAYTDADATGGALAWQMLPSACVLNSYP